MQKLEKALFNIVSNMNHNSFVLTPTGDLTVLRNILLYHFSNGTFINGGLEGGVTNLLKTFQGKNLQVKSVCHLLEGFFFFYKKASNEFLNPSGNVIER